MAGNNTAGGNASKVSGSSNPAPNSTAPKPSTTENMASSISAPSHSGQRGDRRGFRDQRGRGRGSERGKSRRRGNEPSERQKQDVGRSAWRYVTHMLSIDYTAN